ncbi:EAL domain-containing protein [Pseudomonas sp. PDNC002]|uniref:EAL domain-containing protein n=1 Tax=Pseudomonas sp. PDNC002 TaxID=2811422 RepID=UPI00196351E9|nr:EAL domain-containing protein [Pseudomonas sp. PDNC002]QRY77406.1 EAL domain-containing protein [Pseudomonas sp. PDNC002]
MPALSALVLQASGLHRSTAVIALHHLGYGQLSEVTSTAFALDRLRNAVGVHLLICDVRINPLARLEFLQTVAREGLAQGIVISGEMAPGTWTALAHLLQLQGIKAFWLGNEPATLERLRILLADFVPQEQESHPQPLQPEQGRSDGDDGFAFLGKGSPRAYFQPKVDVATAQPYGFEVLARWQCEDGQELSPDVFLPQLRRNGLLDTLLFALMRQAADALRSRGRADLELSFNLEAEQIAQPGFSATLERELNRLELDPRNVTFELTESSPLHAPSLSLENVLRLRLLGCGLAIDDFGCGHSTLQRLVELPFTELKLDRSFLADLGGGNPRRLIVLRNSLALGRELGLHVVAEGVENAVQHRQLQSLGCDAAQGYLFGRPVPAEQLDRLLRTRPPRLRKAELAYKKAESVIRLVE